MDKNTVLTSNIICPHCGYEHLDSWEMDDGEYECDCGGSYVVERIITVEYSTYKVAAAANEARFIDCGECGSEMDQNTIGEWVCLQCEARRD